MKYLKDKKSRKFFRDRERLKKKRRMVRKIMSVQVDKAIEKQRKKARLERLMAQAEQFCRQFTTYI